MKTYYEINLDGQRDRIESEYWADSFDNVDTIYMEISSSGLDNDKIVLDGVAFAMVGSNGEFYDNSGLPIPLVLYTEQDAAFPIEGVSHDSVIEDLLEERRIRDAVRQNEEHMNRIMREALLEEPMDATPAYDLEDVKRFAREYYQMTPAERANLRSQLEDGTLQTPIVEEEVRKVTMDIDMLDIYNNKRRALNREIDQAIARNDSRTDRDVANLSYDRDFVAGKADAIFKDYNLDQDDRISRPQIEVSDDRKQALHDLDTSIHELTDDNYDKFVAEVEMLRDEGLQM